MTTILPQQTVMIPSCGQTMLPWVGQISRMSVQAVIGNSAAVYVGQIRLVPPGTAVAPSDRSSVDIPCGDASSYRISGTPGDFVAFTAVSP